MRGFIFLLSEKSGRNICQCWCSCSASSLGTWARSFFLLCRPCKGSDHHACCLMAPRWLLLQTAPTVVTAREEDNWTDLSCFEALSFQEQTLFFPPRRFCLALLVRISATGKTEKWRTSLSRLQSREVNGRAGLAVSVQGAASLRGLLAIQICLHLLPILHSGLFIPVLPKTVHLVSCP